MRAQLICMQCDANSPVFGPCLLRHLCSSTLPDARRSTISAERHRCISPIAGIIELAEKLVSREVLVSKLPRSGVKSSLIFNYSTSNCISFPSLERWLLKNRVMGVSIGKATGKVQHGFISPETQHIGKNALLSVIFAVRS